MQKRKDVLTTGEVARICNVAPRTVTKWFDSGQLRGYRIPGSRDRRIPTSELIRFMKAHNMPTGMLEKGQMRILIIDSNEQACMAFSDALQAKGSFEVCSVHNSFDAGLMAEKFRPQVILIDMMSEKIDAQLLCTHVRGTEELSDTRIIAMASGITENITATLLKKGFDGVISDAADVNKVVSAIQDCCAVYC